MRIYLAILLLLCVALGAPRSEAFVAGAPPTNGGSSSCANAPPLDSQIGAVAAYSFRRLATAYSGYAVEIQRNSDNTTLNVGFASNGCDFDAATATTFCASTTCGIKTWYDQSGNSANVSQSTQADEPTLTLSCLSSKPCAAMGGTGIYLTGTLASSVTATTFVAEMQYTNTSFTQVGVSINLNQSCLGAVFSPAEYDAQGAGTAGPFGTFTPRDTNFHSFIGIQTTTLASIYVDGTKGTDSTTTKSFTAESDIWLGRNSTGVNNMTAGNIAEVILFAPNIASSNALAVSSNQQTYW